MQDAVRSKLAELVGRFGLDLCNDPRRCEALLRDVCPDHKREILALVSAAREGVGRELRQSSIGVPKEVLLARLTKRLCDQVGLVENLARWAVESWAVALGVTSAVTASRSSTSSATQPVGRTPTQPADVPNDAHFPFRCPACGSQAQMPAKLAGREIRCPQCDTSLRIADDSRAVLRAPEDSLTRPTGSANSVPPSAQPTAASVPSSSSPPSSSLPHATSSISTSNQQASDQQQEWSTVTKVAVLIVVGGGCISLVFLASLRSCESWSTAKKPLVTPSSVASKEIVDEQPTPPVTSTTTTQTADEEPATPPSSAVPTAVTDESPVTPLLRQQVGVLRVEVGEECTVDVAVENAARRAGGLQYRLDSGAPSGASFDSQTGRITWTPTRQQEGKEYRVTVSVRAPNGHSERTTFTIAVIPPIRPDLSTRLPPDPPVPVPPVLPPRKERAFDLGNGVKLEMVFISGGGFIMGNDRGHPDEKPAHTVKISRPFYLGKYEVMQEQWEAVMGGNPSQFRRSWNPVENVSWDDCQDFIKRLNVKVSPRGGRFALPTEAQWEYACRAGGTGKYCFGDSEVRMPEPGLGEYAWYSANSANKAHFVGMKSPNAWGLYDMHGNVGEWCADWYDPAGYNAELPVNDPSGSASGSSRVTRGGGWKSSAATCTSVFRTGSSATFRDPEVGLRVAIVPTDK